MTDEQLARFLPKFRVAEEVHPVLGTACWLWIAGKHRFGYGMFSIDRTMRTAHRVSYKTPVTHCPAGHPYDEANTYQPPGRTVKTCRTCTRLANRRHKQRLREGS